MLLKGGGEGGVRAAAASPAGTTGVLPAAAQVATGAIRAKRLVLHDHFGSRGKTLLGRANWCALPRLGGDGTAASARAAGAAAGTSAAAAATESGSQRLQPGACASRAQRARFPTECPRGSPRADPAAASALGARLLPQAGSVIGTASFPAPGHWGKPPGAGDLSWPRPSPPPCGSRLRWQRSRGN